MSKHSPNHYDAILNELKRALEENKITQIEVGDALGIKQSAVSSLLSGRSKLTVEQLLRISALVGIKPHKLLSAADVLLTQTIPMPYEIESILYKSEIHLVAYCAATQEITADDLVIEEYTREKIKHAMDELVAVGVLIKKKDKYIQKNPNVIYTPSSPTRPTACHQKVVLHSWRLWDKLKEKPGYRLKRFNYFLLDRFTVAQIKEVEAILWRAYERIQSFQRENMVNGYVSDDPMPLWDIHLMLMTPLEHK
ncbi:MAG: helix-turn-helix transcriptional regulator [Candidatus Poribacteria bacterium]|mgnify:CR=1 FL=1